jgi:glycosyltransferase involved in cell wall biosynthesis
MIHGKKVVVVLPAYNAALTLEQTYREIPFDIVDDVVLVDDAGGDNTLEVGAKLGIKNLIKHEKTWATVAIKKVAIAKRWNWEQISSSCSTLIINTHPN